MSEKQAFRCDTLAADGNGRCPSYVFANTEREAQEQGWWILARAPMPGEAAILRFVIHVCPLCVARVKLTFPGADLVRGRI